MEIPDDVLKQFTVAFLCKDCGVRLEVPNGDWMRHIQHIEHHDAIEKATEGRSRT